MRSGTKMQHQHIGDFLRHLNTLHSDKPTLGCDATHSSKPKQHHHVSFSTMSKVHLYKKDKLYSRNVSFSKEDCDEFSARARYDADQIRRLIITVPPPSASFASSIKYLL